VWYAENTLKPHRKGETHMEEKEDMLAQLHEMDSEDEETTSAA